MASSCGGDSDDASGESIAKSAYVVRANAICADTPGQAEEAYGRIIGNRQQTPALAQRFLAPAAEIIASNVERRGEIPAPEEDEGIVEETNSAGKEAAVQFIQAASSRDTAVALMRGITPDPASEFDRLSGEYGLTECAGVG